MKVNRSPKFEPMLKLEFKLNPTVVLDLKSEVKLKLRC